jgi:hypothetical protein
MVTRQSSILVAAVALTVAAACVQGPFERANPRDQGSNYTFTLVASRDTVSPANPIVVLKLVSDPVVVGFESAYSSQDSTRLRHEGNGVFRLRNAPTTFDSVRVTAGFSTLMPVYRMIYRMPNP